MFEHLLHSSRLTHSSIYAPLSLLLQLLLLQIGDRHLYIQLRSQPGALLLQGSVPLVQSSVLFHQNALGV